MILTDSVKRSGGSSTGTLSTLSSAAGGTAGFPEQSWTPSPHSFPWNLPSAATAEWSARAIPLPATSESLLGAHDLSLPLFACHQEQMSGTGGFTTAGSPSADIQQYEDITRTGVLLERTVMITAFRRMPRDWSIPFTLFKATRNTRKNPWVTTSSTGSLTIPFNGQASNIITLNSGTLAGPACLVPGRSLHNAAWTVEPNTSSRTIQWITIGQYPVTPAQGYDDDGDGAPNELETLMGTSSSSINSDGLGHNDGDELNAGVLPPPGGPRLSTRGSDYVYNHWLVSNLPHIIHRLDAGTTTPILAAGADLGDNTPAMDLGTPLQDKLRDLAPFPGSAPASAGIPDIDTAGNASPIGRATAEMVYGVSQPANLIGARGRQTRFWATLPEAPAADRTEMYYLLRTVTHNSGPPVITLTPQPMQFTAGSRTSSNFVDLLAKRPAASGTGDADGVSEKMAPAAILTDTGMAGVLGDLIKSAAPGSTVMHFVTPKGPVRVAGAPATGDPLKDLEHVEFKAGELTAAEFTATCEWEGGEAGPTAEKRKVRRTATGVTILKIKKKAAPQTLLAELHVWTVWATPKTPIIGPSAYAQSPVDASYSVNVKTAPWRFVFKIEPVTIFTLSEIPDLKWGFNPARPVPGSKKPSSSDPARFADTALSKWDISRRMSVTIWNTGLIPKKNLSNVLQSANLIGQPAAFTNPIIFPEDPAEGNDDALTSDELIVPYVADDDPYLGHAIGEVSSLDAPVKNILNIWGKGRPDAYFARTTNFAEFVRLQLWDGKRKEGRFWFRISDDLLWHHRISASFSTSDGSWLDVDSSNTIGPISP